MKKTKFTKEYRTRICKFSLKVLESNFTLSKALNEESYLMRVDEAVDEYIIYQFFGENNDYGHLRVYDQEKVELHLVLELGPNHPQVDIKRGSVNIGRIIDFLSMKELKTAAHTIGKLNSLGPNNSSKKALELYGITDEIDIEAFIKNVQRDIVRKKRSPGLHRDIISF